LATEGIPGSRQKSPDAWLSAARKEALDAARKLKEAAARETGKITPLGPMTVAAPATLQAQHTLGHMSAAAVPLLAEERNAVMSLNASFTAAQGPLRQFVEQHEAANAAMQKFAEGMGRNVTQATVYGRSIRQAAMEAAKATVESIAAKALVEAIYATALGFLYLAEFDFTAAAQAFEAAAIFGAVGGAAATAGAVIPMGARQRVPAGLGSGNRYEAGSSGRSGDYAGGGIGGALAPGAQPAAQPSGGLTVSIMGNEEAGQWLATTLNKAVTQQGVQLVSSASQRGAPVGH
jgi:hypothetical protein